MKYLRIFLLVAVLVVLVSGETRCRKRGTSCNNSDQCCSSYCRAGRCVNWGEVLDERGLPNPCVGRACPGYVYTSCLIREVQCIRFPCPGIADCASRPQS